MLDRHKYKIWSKRRGCYLSTGIMTLFCRRSLQVSTMDEDCTLIQCTGLKDVDGTLIYEGDIIDIQGARAIVEWVDDGWKLIGDSFNGDNLFPQIRSVEGADDGKAMWGKIVGNRFEYNVDEIMKG